MQEKCFQQFINKHVCTAVYFGEFLLFPCAKKILELIRRSIEQSGSFSVTNN